MSTPSPDHRDAPHGSDETATHTPAPLQVAAGLAAIEGVVTVLLGATDAFHVRGDQLTMGVTSALFFLVYGVVLLWAGVALIRRRRWARGPVLLAQLIWLGLAWSFRHPPTTVIAIVLAVVAAIVLAGLVHPDSIDTLERGRE